MNLNSDDAARRIDEQLAHVWTVRAFLKHTEEAGSDEELRDVHRELYDYMLALGDRLAEGQADAYLRQARKKFAKLRKACDDYLRIQPEISGHTNFRMAARSLEASVREIGAVLDAWDRDERGYHARSRPDRDV
ncbi:MAG: amidohydrolase [Planctomycetes bacterium]|nr:amidohydrolase [Planctomycetota bacterium]